MSVQVMTWVIDEAPDDMTPSEMLVALMLANHTTKDGGHAYPSVRTLADETRLSERSVQAALRSLVERGIIRVQASHTRRLPTMYCFPQFRGAESAPHPGLGVQPVRLEVQKTAIRGAGFAPNPLVEPLVEPSEKDMPPARGRYTEDFERFWKPYPATNGSKADAFKAWRQLTQKDRAAAVAALPAWLACDRWRDGYVKHAGAWLRGRMWEVTPTQARVSPNGRAPRYYDSEGKPDPDAARRAELERMAGVHWKNLRANTDLSADERQERQREYRQGLGLTTTPTTSGPSAG